MRSGGAIGVAATHGSDGTRGDEQLAERYTLRSAARGVRHGEGAAARRRRSSKIFCFSLGQRAHTHALARTPTRPHSLRYANEDAFARGGAVAVLDNEHAYDRVAWPFLHQCLEAFGLPECFRGAVKAMYTDVSTRLKINGTLGAPLTKGSGIIQGCPLSSLLFLFVMETLLTLVRENAEIQPLRIPDANGDDSEPHAAGLKERSLADDLAVFMHAPQTSVPALRATLQRFSTMSGQRVNVDKSTLLLLGKDAVCPPGGHNRWWPGLRVTSSDLTPEKYHGVKLCTDVEAASREWQRQMEELRRRLAADAKGYAPTSVQGRNTLAHGPFVPS
jgi:hypothetical protein